MQLLRSFSSGSSPKPALQHVDARRRTQANDLAMNAAVRCRRLGSRSDNSRPANLRRYQRSPTRPDHTSGLRSKKSTPIVFIGSALADISWPASVLRQQSFYKNYYMTLRPRALHFDSSASASNSRCRRDFVAGWSTLAGIGGGTL